MNCGYLRVVVDGREVDGDVGSDSETDKIRDLLDGVDGIVPMLERDI